MDSPVVQFVLKAKSTSPTFASDPSSPCDVCSHLSLPTAVSATQESPVYLGSGTRDYFLTADRTRR